MEAYVSLILNRRDLDFILYDVLNIADLCNHPRYSDHSKDVFDHILDAAEKLATTVLHPIAKQTDIEEPEFDDGRAVFPSVTGDALDQLREGGFFAASFDNELGGLQLPYSVTQGIAALLGAANGGIYGYSMLTIAAANLLVAHASEEQVQTFVPPMVEGRFFGTMCLSEPQAGSSLADIKTKAVRGEDGTYRLFGSKMWISGGEHDLSENIVHLVLAKTPDSPPGVKGISLFIVPRILIDENGNLGDRNEVKLVGVNHKMGNRATINTALSFGDQDGAIGYLIGEEGRGLSYMFHMMNEARIGVGLGAATTAYSGYLHALDYAKERTQGRPLDQRDPASSMIPIIEHGDVKRMLLQQKAYCEGALALCLYGALLIDQAETTEDANKKQHLSLLLEILTPIMKSWPSEFGVRANDQAIQVHGGYGYTREYAVERLYRDNRLNPIHEGTKGIQGLDLLGRKVSMMDRAALHALDQEIRQTLKELGQAGILAAEAHQLEKAWVEVCDTARLVEQAALQQGRSAALANATIYLDAFGHVIVAWIWLKQALAANQSSQPDAFKQGKLKTARYFFKYELPSIYPQCALVSSVDTTCLEMENDWL